MSAPANPKAIKKTIAKESQADEKEYQRALKDLKRIEKSQAKASRAVTQADKHLKIMEEKEQDTVKSLQKATHSHDQAVTNLHNAQSNVEIQKGHAQRLKRNIDTLRARVDEVFKAKQDRDEERGRRLANLRPPEPDSCTPPY